MSASRLLETAFGALRARRRRSLLTMLGVVIGVAAVITMVAIGQGAQLDVEMQIESLGANLLQIYPDVEGDPSRDPASPLTEMDAEALTRLVPELDQVAPGVEEELQIVYGSHHLWSYVVGVVPAHLFIREWSVTSGRALVTDDVDRAARVAVIGTNTAAELFGSDDPVGRELRVASVPFDIIGVLERKGISPFGHDQDSVVFVPLTTAKMRLEPDVGEIDPDAVEFIYTKVRSTDLMARAVSRIELVLRQQHRLPSGSNDDFVVNNIAATLRTQLEAGNTFTLLLASVATVSLVVGGIGIMNMMIVAVTERTREIGLRLAVGASPAHIRNQFLTEAIVLCLAGGLLGVVVGVGASYTVARFADWPVIINGQTIALALGSSVIVGIFFGLYPAVLASRLDPIAALRSE